MIKHSYKSQSSTLHNKSINLQSSSDTSTAQTILVQDKILYQSICQSTITQTQKFLSQNSLMLTSKYLSASNEREEKQILILMENHFQMLQEQEKVCLLNLQNGHNDQYGLIMSYYFQNWLVNVGYFSKKNKKYVLSRIKLHLGLSYVKQAAEIYETLFKKCLDKDSRLSIIADICKNGQEVMISWIIKCIKNNHIIA